MPAPGRVTLLLDGAGSGTTLVPELCIAAAAEGMLAIVVDGGNAFSAYPLVEAARRTAARARDSSGRAGFDVAYALSSVRVARAFTAYQFQALVEDALPAEVREAERRGERVGLVAVVGFPELYSDEDVPAREARVLATRALAAVRQLAGAPEPDLRSSVPPRLRVILAGDNGPVAARQENTEERRLGGTEFRAKTAPSIPVVLTAGMGDGRARTMMDRHGWGMPVRVSSPARLPWLRRLLEEGADEVATVRPTAHGLRVRLPLRGAEVLLAAGRQRSLLDFPLTLQGDPTWDVPNRPSASSWTGSSRSGTITVAASTRATPQPSTASSVAREATRARA